MKKRISMILGGLIIILAVFAYAHISKTHCVYDRYIDASDYKDTASYMNGEIVQEFECQEDHLDGIRVKCRIIGIIDNVKVNYSLTEANTGMKVAEGTVQGDQFVNSKFYEFAFDTVSECKNKEYEFKLSITGEDPENYISFCYTGENEKDTNFYLNGDKTEGTLVLKTVTNRFDMETFCVLLVFVIYIVLFIKFLYRLFK